MTVRLYRYSGYPVNPLLKDVIKREYKAGYDEIEKDIGALSEETKDLWPKRLESLDQALFDKYPRFEDRIVNSISEIQEMVKFYGCTMAFCFEKQADESELFTCYIMDLA
jgi:hypothetical protein